MKIISLFLTIIVMLFFGCKNVPAPNEPEALEEPEIFEALDKPQALEEPEETNVLTKDEIDIVDEVINYIIVNDIRLPKGEMQVSINNTFFVYKSRYTDSYENDLLNSESYLKDSLAIDENIISSFIKRNIRRRTIDRDTEFNSDFFWNGDPYNKEYFRMIFSNIGFNKNNTEAIIYTYIDLPTMRYAKYIFLKKENGIWKFNKFISPQRT